MGLYGMGVNDISDAILQGYLNRTANQMPNIFLPSQPIQQAPPIAQPQIPLPQTATNIMNSTPQASPKPLPESGRNNFGEILRAIGLPAISTIAGLANPNMLAGAAGFNQGYGTQYAKQRNIAQESASQLDKLIKWEETKKKFKDKNINIDDVINQAESGTLEKNPYAKDYPDAFQEDGIWKVLRDGKKYRIEE